MTFLAEVARLAASTRTWDELMVTIVDRAQAAAGADVCSLYLMDRDGAGITLAATNGLAKEYIGRARLRLGQGITGIAAETRTPVTSLDIRNDERFAWITGPDQPHTSMCSVPLIWNDQVVGVLNVQTVRPRRFRASDVRFLETLAALLAGIVEKGRLQQEAEAQIESLRAIDEARANLIAVVTHALRTPLAVVRAYVELLGGRAQAGEQPDAQVWEREALQQVDRLDQAVDSILESMRIFPSGSMEIGPMDLTAVVEETVKELGPLFRRHRLATDFLERPLRAHGAAEPTRRLLGYCWRTRPSTRRSTGTSTCTAGVPRGAPTWPSRTMDRASPRSGASASSSRSCAWTTHRGERASASSRRGGWRTPWVVSCAWSRGCPGAANSCWSSPRSSRPPSARRAQDQVAKTSRAGRSTSSICSRPSPSTRRPMAGRATITRPSRPCSALTQAVRSPRAS